VRKILLVVTVATSLATSGCVALVAGAAGAGTLACTEEELNCPVD
jgi:hypothetical protein